MAGCMAGGLRGTVMCQGTFISTINVTTTDAAAVVGAASVFVHRQRRHRGPSPVRFQLPSPLARHGDSVLLLLLVLPEEIQLRGL